jgi:hypothetical protein
MLVKYHPPIRLPSSHAPIPIRPPVLCASHEQRTSTTASWGVSCSGRTIAWDSETLVEGKKDVDAGGVSGDKSSS